MTDSSNTGLSIRRATDRDVEAVTSLLEQVLEIHAAIRPDIFISGTTKYTPEELKNIFANDNTPVYVAVNERDEVIGHLFCIIKDEPATNNTHPQKIFYIDDLCVDEKARAMHAGTALFDFAKVEAARLGCKSITLHIWEGNDSAMAFYKKMGMKPRYTCLEL